MNITNEHCGAESICHAIEPAAIQRSNTVAEFDATI